MRSTRHDKGIQRRSPEEQLRSRASVDIKRRRTLVVAAIAAAIPLLAPSSLSHYGGMTGEAPGRTDDVSMAIAFVQNRYFLKRPVVYQPVSLLQRQFRLGYQKALRLAQELERIHFWQIHEPQPGQRTAELNPAFDRNGNYLVV